MTLPKGRGRVCFPHTAQLKTPWTKGPASAILLNIPFLLLARPPVCGKEATHLMTSKIAGTPPISVFHKSDPTQMWRYPTYRPERTKVALAIPYAIVEERLWCAIADRDTQKEEGQL